MQLMSIWGLLQFSLFSLLFTSSWAIKEHQKETLPSSRCQKCHPAIYEEWQTSRHGAFSADFRFAAQGLPACQTCHFPKALLKEPAGLPETRSEFMDERVNCRSCHFDGKGMVSPAGDKAQKAAFCGKCHRQIYQQVSRSSISPLPLSCQQCHQPSRQGAATRKWLRSSKKGHHASHTFAANPRQLTQLFRAKISPLEVSTNTLQLELSLWNFLPHSLPAGDYGHRRLSAKVTLLDAQDDTIAERQVDFYLHGAKNLPPQQQHKQVLEFFPLPASPEKATLELWEVRSWLAPRRLEILKSTQLLEYEEP